MIWHKSILSTISKVYYKMSPSRVDNMRYTKEHL